MSKAEKDFLLFLKCVLVNPFCFSPPHASLAITWWHINHLWMNKQPAWLQISSPFLCLLCLYGSYLYCPPRLAVSVCQCCCCVWPHIRQTHMRDGGEKQEKAMVTVRVSQEDTSQAYVCSTLRGGSVWKCDINQPIVRCKKTQPLEQVALTLKCIYSEVLAR